MDHRRVSFEELSRLLPPLEELESLRLSILAAAEPDPEKAWDRSNTYTTIDRRVLSWSDLERIMEEGEAAAHAHVSSVFEVLTPLLSAAREGRAGDGVRQMVVLGEHFEGMGMLDRARFCYDAALASSLPLPEKEPQILALRRVARVCLTKGEPTEALAYYERSATLAEDARSAHGEIVARTGMGNVLSVQGWLTKAEDCYRTALARLESVPERLALERAQICNNLAFVTTQQGKLEEARRWVAEAEVLWRELDSPNDLAICRHNQARLREREGKPEEGLRVREEALRIATLPQLLAGIAAELGESYLKLDRIDEAEQWVRIAEQHAIAARSPWLLGSIYQGLGNIARARAAADGFVFYEKALGIARERSLPFLEADTLVDYAILRRQTGETEEARAYLERALELLDELGAVHERDRARGELATLPPAATIKDPSAG